MNDVQPPVLLERQESLGNHVILPLPREIIDFPQFGRHGVDFFLCQRTVVKDYLVRRIAWQLQALAEGNLTPQASTRARQLVAEIGKWAPERPKSPERTPQRDPRLPAPGTVLVRPYRGRTRQVKVLKAGFEYDGRRFATLTAVAKEITGQHWNGFHFFGLNQPERSE